MTNFKELTSTSDSFEFSHEDWSRDVFRKKIVSFIIKFYSSLVSSCMKLLLFDLFEIMFILAWNSTLNVSYYRTISSDIDKVYQVEKLRV